MRRKRVIAKMGRISVSFPAPHPLTRPFPCLLKSRKPAGFQFSTRVPFLSANHPSKSPINYYPDVAGHRCPHASICTRASAELWPIRLRPVSPLGSSSGQGGHIVGREETQLIMKAAGPPGWVGAVQNLYHLAAAQAQFINFHSLEVIQCPGPPHSLEETRRHC